MRDDLATGTTSLSGKTIANLDLSGVSARQYLEVIINAQLITQLGEEVFIFLGVNDIVKEPNYSPEQVLTWIIKIVEACKTLSPHSRYYLLENTPVNHIKSTNNQAIKCLNDYFENNCPKDMVYLKTWDRFSNHADELDLTLGTDGLHFSEKGYQVLQSLLEAHISK